MAKNDQGYKVGRARSGGYGRSRSPETILSQTSKQELTDAYLRTKTRGILDIMGLDENDDVAMQIKQGIVDEFESQSQTKAAIDAATQSFNDGLQAYMNNAWKTARIEGAQVLIGALESRTRATERENLDEGEFLDDPASLLVDGSGWGEERVGARTYRKHVNIAIDNSGSTHTPATGFPARAMQQVTENLMGILFEAASKWPGVTWDAFSFNRVTKQHTGRFGQHERAEVARQALEHITVLDPLKRDAVETNLAPLLEQMYKNDVARNLLDSPRLDIILTDGEFESQEDADQAAEWQRQRGPDVITYVLNVCPETPSEVTLPHQFRVIPLECQREDIARIDPVILRQSLMRIVLDEVQKESQ